jgi:hypothetical protein
MKKLITAFLAGAFALAVTAAFAQMNPAPKTGNAPNGTTTSTSGVEKDETIPKAGMNAGKKSSAKMKKNQTTGSGNFNGSTSKPGAGVDKD